MNKEDIKVPGTLEINAKGQNVSTGFIDLHVDGGGGHFFDGSEDAFFKFTEAHFRYRTAMCSTALSGDLEELYKKI